MLTKNEIIGICSAVAGIIIIIIIGTSMKGDSSRITSVILNQPSSYIPSFVELGSFGKKILFQQFYKFFKLKFLFKQKEKMKMERKLKRLISYQIILNLHGL